MPAAQVDTESKAKRTTRAHALQLIHDADKIFVAYSHSNYPLASKIRKKIVKLRKNHPPSTVYLDQEFIPPGQSISPDIVDAALIEANLVLALCGMQIARSLTLQREIKMAVEREQAGGCKILPILIDAHVTLPEGIDSRIQGIFYTHLFPGVVVMRWVVGAVLLGLALAASVLGVWASRSNLEKAKAGIDRALAQDEILRVPSNLGRASQLKNTLEEARHYHYKFDDVQKLLDQIPPETARQELLPANANRKQMLVSFDGSRLYIGCAKTIEVWSLNDDPPVKQQSFDLTAIDVPKPSNDTGNSSKTAAAVKRAPAELVKLWLDRYSSDTFVEVEYADFSIPMKQGEDFDYAAGQEREVFRIHHEGNSLESAGLSRELVPNNYPDDPLDPGNTINFILNENSKDTLLADLAQPPALHRICLASDAAGPAYIAEVDEPGKLNDVSADFEEIYAEIVGPDMEVKRISQRIWYNRMAVGFRQYDEPQPDPEVDGAHEPNDISAGMPQYLPAALNWAEKKAVLGSTLVSFSGPGAVTQEFLHAPTPFAWEENDVKQMYFTPDAKQLILMCRDESVALFDLKEEKIVHHFLNPLRAVAADVSRSNSRVIDMRDDGSVESWDLSAFGPDGWAAKP